MSDAQRAVQFHGGDEANGGVFAVETRIPPGFCLEAHRHKHGHMSVLAKGEALVTINGVSQRHVGPCVITVPADVQHSVVSVTDVVWYCLWAGDLVDQQQAQDSLRVVEAAMTGAGYV